MNKKELKAIRERMGLKQTEFAARLRINQGSVSRMESGEMIITPPMELLIELVAKEAGVEVTHAQAGSRAATPKAADRAGAGHPRESKSAGRKSHFSKKTLSVISVRA